MKWDYAIGLLIFYVILDLIEHFIQRNWFSKLLGVLQFIIFLISLFYLFTFTIFPRNFLFFPSWLPGIVLGHILYTLGLIITTGNLLMWKHIASFGDIIKFCFLSPLILGRTFAGAVLEEIIYRGCFQTIFIRYLNNPLLGIMIVAFGFLLVHKHIFDSTMTQNIEFFVFSIILGIIYYYTDDLGLVSMIHFFRNMSTSYLDFVEKFEEKGDREQAIAEMESQLSQAGFRRV